MSRNFKTAAIIFIIFAMCFSMLGMTACDDAPEDEKPGGIYCGIPSDPGCSVRGPEGDIVFTFSPAAANADYKAAADRYVDAFLEKYPQVNVERDYTALTDTRMSTYDVGDVFYFAEALVYKYTMYERLLLPLDGFFDYFDIDISDIYSEIYSTGIVEGRMYFVPNGYYQPVLIYNKTVTDKAGMASEIKPDWTWEEFRDIASRLYDETGDYYPLRYNITDSLRFIPFLEAYTPSRDTWCSTSEKRITFLDEEGSILRAIGEILDMAHKNQVVFPGINDMDEAVTGKEPVFSDIVYTNVLTQAETYDKANIEWDVVNMPLFPNPSFGCGAAGVGVFSRTRNIQASAAFALFFLTPDGQRAFNSGRGGAVPLLKSLHEEGFDAWKYPNDQKLSSKNWDAFIYLAGSASTVSQPYSRMPAEVSNAILNQIGTILTNDLRGSMDYVEGFRLLEERCNDIWERLIV